MNPLLQIKNLSVEFVSGQETVKALNKVSLTLNRGEILAIVGESGSGKSVSSLSILKLLPTPPAIYTGGEILFSESGGMSVDLLQFDQQGLQQIRGNKIAMIFQEPMTSLNPVINCGNQVVEAIRLHKKVTVKEARSSAIEWFEKVKLPNPSSILNRYPHQLSGGQKQRVMIAMAMCCHPSILICDEPTTALDVTVQQSILELIRELQRQENMGVIFITHDLGVVASIADRAAVMYRGEIVETNGIRDVFSNPQHPYTKALLACRPVNHPRGERLPIVSDFLGKDDGPLDRADVIDNLVKKPVAILEEKSESADLNRLLKVEHLSVHFPTKSNLFGKTLQFISAVDDVNFELYKGETLGLVGESGCGKTTLGRTLLRLIEPTEGRILYNGIDLAAKKRTELQSLRKDIQIIFQDPYSSLNPRLTIGSAITEPLLVHEMLPTSRQRRERVEELLEKVNLDKGHFNRYPHEFSGGQRQRIVIARALALEPSFIVCDESVSALDISVQAQVLNLLNDLKRELGFTIIFISHDLAVVRYISDRILVMNKGKIEESGKADDIYFNPQSDYTKKLINSIPKGLPVSPADRVG